jgi:ATP-dependent Clp protease adapter protein ClpS
MIHNIEGMSKTVVPYNGYPPGISVILYNDNSHNVTEVVTALMNSGFFTEMEAYQVTMITSQKGFFIVPFNQSKDKAEKLVKNLRKINLQCELILSEGPTPRC